MNLIQIPLMMYLLNLQEIFNLMNTFFQFIIKELYHIIRDFRTLLVLFGLPLAQLIILGYAVRTDINDANIAILDYSKDYMTKQLTDKILSSGYYNLKTNLNTENEIETFFKSGTVKQVIVYQNNFAHQLLKEGKVTVQIINDASNPNVATMLNTYTSLIIMDYQQELINKNNIPKLNIIPEIKMLYNEELKSVFMFVPGLITFILMLVSALMTSLTITKEKELGTMEVLLVSPLKPFLIIIGKVIPYIGLSLFNTFSILILSMTIFHIPFKGSFILFFAEALLFITTALSLGIFISTITNTQQVAMLASLAGLLVPTILLSGFIFPTENMPIWLQYISNIIPAKWFLIIVKDIILKGNGLEYFWKETLVLVGMTSVFIVLSVLKFKVRL